ncbi:MAG: ATP-binding cassette domain-containing protein, partial [Burkholderiaceae bacterium]|nr:ATP-binding cassette domain-containing protein [Burkholderiaceae bacterium]
MPTSSTSGALHIERLVKEYRPGTPVLKSIDLTIAHSGLTSIIGPSGTGKSTLIRCINRLVAPTSGRILLNLAGEQVDMAQLR